MRLQRTTISLSARGIRRTRTLDSREACAISRPMNVCRRRNSLAMVQHIVGEQSSGARQPMVGSFEPRPEGHATSRPRRALVATHHWCFPAAAPPPVAAATYAPPMSWSPPTSFIHSLGAAQTLAARSRDVHTTALAAALVADRGPGLTSRLFFRRPLRPNPGRNWSASIRPGCTRRWPSGPYVPPVLQKDGGVACDASSRF